MFSIQTPKKGKSKSKAKSVSPIRLQLNETKSELKVKGNQTPRLYDFPKIPSYYRVGINHENKKDKNYSIMHKLDFERKVKMRVERRTIEEDLFLKYTKNPFLNRSQKVIRTV